MIPLSKVMQQIGLAGACSELSQRNAKYWETAFYRRRSDNTHMHSMKQLIFI